MEMEEPITTTDVEGRLYMTQANIAEDDDVEEEEEEDEEEDYQDQLGHLNSDIKFNFDEPFSKLPKNVPIDRVKKNVCASYKNQKYTTFFTQLFDTIHITAIISDSFWYIICRLFRPGVFIEEEELFLDRIAANYVSFTLRDEFQGESKTTKSKKTKKVSNNFYKNLHMKDKFYENFYNAIAQSVFSCLYYAYSKSRSKLNDDIKRELLDIFSELFTGTQIKSAEFKNWNVEVAPSNVLTNAHRDMKKDDRALSLADVKQSKTKLKSDNSSVHMKYSPLVERYLKAHKYETMNNVREWKMKLTQRSGIQKEIDEKFEKYQRIAQQAVEEKDRVDQEYKSCVAEFAKLKASQEAEAKRHIDMLKKRLKDLMENGCAEYANKLVSLFNYEYASNIDEF